MKTIRGLYVIVDPQQTRGRDPVDVARLALAGGARIIQWRDKTRDKGEQIAPAQAVRDLCRERGALFLVNDHVDLALALSADGAHLGQKDLPPSLVRPWLPAGFLLGVSSNTVDEARRAERDGADYVGVGAIFSTMGKEVTRPASPERLREVIAAVDLPVVAIGGINEGNIDEVIEAGADAVAVISAVCLADDVEAAARRLASRFG
ncbi:MAG TPA: thiamine phosphate synthase [Dehalococcoidia bacterium]|nr:thiamine phosphate synthase [Dehalococcoidia bacterium]